MLSQSTKAFVLLSALSPPSLASWSACVASPRSRNEVAPPSASSRSWYDASRSQSSTVPPSSSHSSRSLAIQSAPTGALTAKSLGLDLCSLVVVRTIATSSLTSSLVSSCHCTTSVERQGSG